MNDFDRFRPCERMRKHAFADRNTQHMFFVQITLLLGNFNQFYLLFNLQTGHTALQRAAAEGHVEIIKTLLENGVSVDHQDEVVSLFIFCVHFS